MKINPVLTRAFVVSTMVFSSCHWDDEHSAYPDLKIFLDRFEDEAGKLGYDFDLSGIDIVYVDEIVKDRPYCGYGYPNYDGNGQRRIEISRSGICGWSDRNDVERENLVFHELGHAFFQRRHDETMQCDGSPLSLMVSKVDNWRVYDTSNEEKRTYYIAELIDPIVGTNECIAYDRTWTPNTVIYTYQKGDSRWLYESSAGKYIGEENNEDKLSISSQAPSNADEGAYWYTTLEGLAIPECAEVTLKVRMNSAQLTGNGAAIAIRLYDAPLGRQGATLEQSLFLSTETPASGKLVNYTEELTITCYTRKTIYMVLFAMMQGGTEGTVDFDQIQVLVNKK